MKKRIKNLHFLILYTNVISDTLNFYQYFLRNGEGSKAVMPIPNKNLHIYMQNMAKNFVELLI